MTSPRRGTGAGMGPALHRCPFHTWGVWPPGPVASATQNDEDAHDSRSWGPDGMHAPAEHAKLIGDTAGGWAGQGGATVLHRTPFQFMARVAAGPSPSAAQNVVVGHDTVSNWPSGTKGRATGVAT